MRSQSEGDGMTPEEMATRLYKIGEEIVESIEWLAARTDAKISPRPKGKSRPACTESLSLTVQPTHR